MTKSQNARQFPPNWVLGRLAYVATTPDKSFASVQDTSRVFASVEGLRFFAALLVVLFHAGVAQTVQGVDFGKIGVKLFFVISGFVITLSTHRPQSFSDYAVKRISRIVPSYWVMTGVVIVGSIILPRAFNSGAPSLTEIVQSLAFIPFVKSSGLVQPVLFLGWTLNIEMVFYALFGIALVVVPRYKEVVVAATLVVLGVSAYFLHPANPVLAFYIGNYWLCFAWGIIIGMLTIGFIPAQLVKLQQRSQGWVPGLFLAVLTALCFAFQPLVDTGISWGLLTLTLITVELGVGFPAKQLLRSLGALTYSVYLTHQIIISAFTKVVAKGKIEPGSVLCVALSLPLAIFAGLVFYRIIDRPLSRYLKTVLSSRLKPKNG